MRLRVSIDADLRLATQVDEVLCSNRISPEAIVPFRSWIVFGVSERVRTGSEPDNRFTAFQIVANNFQLRIRQRKEPQVEDSNVGFLQRV